MGPLESDELTMRFAQRSAELILRRPELRYEFAKAVRSLRDRNGPKIAYDTMEAACVDSVTLCALLQARSHEGDLIRSMAPFYAVLPENERLEIIRLANGIRSQD